MIYYSPCYYNLHAIYSEPGSLPPVRDNPDILPHLHQACSDAIEFTAVPSTVQPLLAYGQIRACQERRRAAKHIGDQEGAIEADYKLRQVPFTCIASLSATIAGLKTFSATKDLPFVKAALGVSVVFGFICAVFETIYESFWIYRLQRFLNKPEIKLLQLMQQELSLEQVQKIFIDYNKYLRRHLPANELEYATYCQNPLRIYGVSDATLARTAREAITSLALRCLKNKYFSEEGAAERVKLERRIRPWCYALIQKEITSAINLLDSCYQEEVIQGREKAELIFRSIDTQIKKKRFLHILGLAGAALSITLLVLAMISLPWTAPLVLLISFYALSSFQYIAYAGLLDNQGWKFTASTCIPVNVKKTAAKIADMASRFYTFCTDLIKNCINRQQAQPTVLLPAPERSSRWTCQPALPAPTPQEIVAYVHV